VNSNSIKRIAVIGGGPGGYVAAIRSAQIGAEVTVIEKRAVGGTCLNEGCIPTKTLYRSAELARTFPELEAFGIKAQGFDIAMDRIQERKDEVIGQLKTGIETLLRQNGIEYIRGTATFEDAHTLIVESDEGCTMRTFDAFIIATGSIPMIPPIDGAELPDVLTSSSALELEAVPKRLVVIGGGVIGMELAEIYNAFGTEVTVVEFADQLLGRIDAELSKRYASGLKKRGITVYKRTRAEAIESNGDHLSVLCRKEGEDAFALEGDKVLLSIGRRPNAVDLGLDRAGVEWNAKGIAVNAHYQSSQPHIYAVGDVNGICMLAHAASHQGVYAAEHLLLGAANHEMGPVPSCIFVFPEMASVGMTEEEIKETGMPYKKSKFMLGANGKALSLGEPEGMIKVLSDMDDVLLGVHIMGAHASDLIHEAALAITNGLKADAVAKTIHAHPTLSEAFAEAVMGLDGLALHMAPVKKK